MLEKVSNYILFTIILMMVTIFISAFSFGGYSMRNAMYDTFAIVWAVGMTESIYQFVKSFIDK